MSVNQFAKSVLSKWPWLVSGVWIGVVVWVFKTCSITDAGQIGSYFSGAAGILAFIWLIAGFMQQKEELKLQRQELGLQRVSLEQQKEELKKMAKYTALPQVATILEDAKNFIISQNFPSIQQPDQILTALVEFAPICNKILISENDDEIISLSKKWIQIEVMAANYICAIVTASNLYLESINSSLTTTSTDAAEDDNRFVQLNYEHFKKIPYVSSHIEDARMLAEILIATEKTRREVMSACVEAANRKFKNDLKKKDD